MSSSDPYKVVATVVHGHTFTVSKRYCLDDSKILGRGSFGVVCTAIDTLTKRSVAIKRIRPYANDDWDARHTLREIRLLRLLGPHPNVCIYTHIFTYLQCLRTFMNKTSNIFIVSTDHQPVRLERVRGEDRAVHGDGADGL